MNALRRLRLQMGLSQGEFATRLGVAEQTYRTWDSGRRIPPRSIVHKARRLKETDSGKLFLMQILAAEYRVHVRTLRKAARDGRLEAQILRSRGMGRGIRRELRRSPRPVGTTFADLQRDGPP